jgi:hypothetical protein
MLLQCRWFYDHKKNFEFRIEKACTPQIHILILEVSQGGNSHQSETNLIERPLKQHLPGARKGLSRSFRKTLTSLIP